MQIFVGLRAEMRVSGYAYPRRSDATVAPSLTVTTPFVLRFRPRDEIYRKIFLEISPWRYQALLGRHLRERRGDGGSPFYHRDFYTLQHVGSDGTVLFADWNPDARVTRRRS